MEFPLCTLTPTERYHESPSEQRGYVAQTWAELNTTAAAQGRAKSWT